MQNIGINKIRVEYEGKRIGRKFEMKDGIQYVNLIVGRFCDSAYLNGKDAGLYEVESDKIKWDVYI